MQHNTSNISEEEIPGWKIMLPLSTIMLQRNTKIAITLGFFFKKKNITHHHNITNPTL